MTNIKQTLAISLPITIILIFFALFGNWNPTIGGILIVLAIMQGIFWKFIKWT